MLYIENKVKKNITNDNCHFNNSIMEPSPNNKPTDAYNKCAWPHFNRVLCESNESLVSVILKGSYDDAKNNIIWCIWCNAMRLCGLRLKKHILYIIVAPLCSAFLKHVDFYKAHRSEKCALIGQLSSALWLAEYLKHETEMLRPSPYCDAFPGVMRLKQ